MLLLDSNNEQIVLLWIKFTVASRLWSLKSAGFSRADLPELIS